MMENQLNLLSKILHLLDICTKFENLCSQICEPTEDSYLCKCETGYKLANDKKTCIKDDEDSSTDKSNEVPINSTEYDEINDKNLAKLHDLMKKKLFLQRLSQRI